MTKDDLSKLIKKLAEEYYSVNYGRTITLYDFIAKGIIKVLNNG